MKKTYRIKNGAPYVFMVLPALIIFVTFFIVPLIYTAKYSFYNWTNFSQEITFSGLENYKSIFEDDILVRSIKNTLIFAIVTVTVQSMISLPVSVFLQVWRNFCYAVPGAFACRRIEAAVAAHDLKKANFYHLTIVPLSIGIPSALLVFCSLFFGADIINNALNAIPQFVMDGLNVASGVMVCIGFALLIRTMGDNKLLPWLFLGFIMVIYLGMDVIGVAAAAICIALIQAFGSGSGQTKSVAVEEEEDF